MPRNIMDDIATQYKRVHESVLKSIEYLDDQQLTWRHSKTTPSIAFHVWHIARWADIQQSIINNGGQIWNEEKLSQKWGFSGSDLGYSETGMGMDDNVSASLAMPKKEILLDYARKAYKKAGLAVEKINDDMFHNKAVNIGEIESWFPGLKGMTIGQAILLNLFHERGHLGMIECMLGVMGFHGSITV